MAEDRGAGSVVLVHGLWGNPHDWHWVIEHLAKAQVPVVVPDLPSHRFTTAGLIEDAEEVATAIRRCDGPVVVVGWSYGVDVISVAAAGQESVKRLICVSGVPGPVGSSEEDANWMDEDPHVRLNAAGTFVLDNRWWLTEEAGTTFASEVVEHLWRHPRRSVSRKVVTDPLQAAAWQEIPATVIIGRHDQLISGEQMSWALEALPDVRLWDVDHFVLFRRPESVADVILEALQLGDGPGTG